MSALESKNVSEIRVGVKKVLLVGTAHVSEESVSLVEQVIREVRPDAVAIELDIKRFEALSDPDRWKQTDLYKVIKDGNSYLLFTQLLLQSFQKKISQDLGVKPGAEMLAGANAAKEIGSQIICIDRDIRLTLKRAWLRASWWSVIKVFFALAASIFDPKKVESDDIERLKEQDVLSAALEEFSTILPDVKTSLIDERDSYMAEKIRQTPGEVIVAIVGAGHVPGITREVNRPHDLIQLEALPPKTIKSKLLSWSFPAIIFTMVVIGFFMGGGSTSQEMVESWIFITGTFAAIGALIPLGHPLSIATAFVTAPLTTLHPLLAAGWFSGLVEAMIKKPRVADLESISEDLNSIRGWFKNRVSRVLLVVMFTNLGAALGAVVGTMKLVKQLL